MLTVETCRLISTVRLPKTPLYHLQPVIRHQKIIFATIPRYDFKKNGQYTAAYIMLSPDHNRPDRFHTPEIG